MPAARRTEKKRSTPTGPARKASRPSSRPKPGAAAKAKPKAPPKGSSKSRPAAVKPAPKKAAPPAKRSAPPAPPPPELNVPLPGGRRHVLSLSFLRDGDEFLARLETDAGHITELKNRSLDQLLTLVAGELEDLLI